MWSLFKKKAGHDLNDEDRALSQQMRMRNKEMALLKAEQEKEYAEKLHDLRMAKLDYELEKYLPDEEEETQALSENNSPESLMASMAMMALMGNKSPAPPVGQHTTSPLSGARHPPATTSAQPSDEGVHITDEEIKEYWSRMPALHKKMAKAAPVAVIENKIREHVPGIDQDSLNRAVMFVKNQ